MTIPEIRRLCLVYAFDAHGPKTISAIIFRAQQLLDWVFKDCPTSEIDSEVIKKLNSLNTKIDKMGENTDKALADLQEIKDNLAKVSAESTTLLQKITDLENAAANADTPQSVLDAIAEVKSQAKAVDDLVPDAPETPVE